jgi:hypothetical protein
MARIDVAMARKITMTRATISSTALRLFAVALGLSFGLTAIEAQACSPVKFTKQDLWKNKRVKQAKDCSFVNGGINDSTRGKAAQDLGNGRILQKIGHENAILLDCTAGTSVLIYGTGDRANITTCGIVYELERYEAPAGPLDYRAGAELTEFKQIAGRLGIEFVEDAVRRVNAGARRRDIVDLACGCKLFYAGSKGAET